MQALPLPEEVAPQLARWLAPYVAAELARLPAADSAPSSYDDRTCGEYVRDIGTPVLNRAIEFFMKLDTDGRVGSVELAQHLSIGTPRNIPSNLTNSLKQRAKAMRLQRPWDETVSADNRTVWVDRDGIAARMVKAIQAEQHRRFAALS